MAFFGDSKAVEELEKLKSALQKSEAARKKLAGELAAAQQRGAELAQQLASMAGELDKARAAVLKARKRQRASVERANRFKDKLGAVSGL